MKWIILLTLALASLAASPARAQAISECPDDFSAFAGATDPLTCSCSAQAAERGSVWGMDVYTGDSSVCKAAVHAGAITRRGGQVTVTPEAGRPAYPGLTRNGVSSSNYGAYASSFRFAGAAGRPNTAADGKSSDSKSGPAGVPAETTAAISECPDDFSVFAETAEALTCSCSAQAAERGSVWGMDVYTGDSSVCKAAVHAGAITRRGGQVTVTPEAGRPAYPGLTRNGVSSSNFGAYASSFRVAGERRAASAPTGQTTQVLVSECPNDFSAFADTSEPLICTCSAQAADRGSVWGMDVYTGDSSVCKAAVHAGAINRRGGQVTVSPDAGQATYAGVTRNGISSSNYGSYASSFRFGPAPSGPTVCPDNFVAFQEITAPLGCTCDRAAMERGSVWGMDVYTADSSVCKAAVHAGAVPRQGGLVSVIPEPGRNAYPGLTRNGVTSSNYGPYDGSFRFPPRQGATAAAPAKMATAPVQQNITQSLRERGEVDLYVQFRFNSAELDLSAADTLRELRNVLAADTNLRLGLIGHTDSVGTADYNRSLSYRRAEAVGRWLVQQGIATSRLTIDGRGRAEPIADNATEAGRAANRRVQALKL
ncbi:LCCL domain-containing protein [Phreatobacter stygius]|nr:LCCL domain-containing protein [Phreatobacter stygius]